MTQLTLKTIDWNFVRDVFRNHQNYEWSIQGFGFLRTYLDSAQIFRLHLWVPEMRAANVSDVHDHPWDFTSKIIAGEMKNYRYSVRPNPLGRHRRETIRPGENAAIIADAKPCDINIVQEETYYAGGMYSQIAEEVHRTEVKFTCVSVIKRRFRENRERAFSFREEGRPWVDAKPRPATHLEVLKGLTLIEPYFLRESN